MVATGGAEPSDCAVLRLPDFQPVQTLVVRLVLRALLAGTAALAGACPSTLNLNGLVGCILLIQFLNYGASWQGHMDWVFGTAWVSDRHLVTASRDQVGRAQRAPMPARCAPLLARCHAACVAALLWASASPAADGPFRSRNRSPLVSRLLPPSQCVALWSLPEAGSGAPEVQYQGLAAEGGGGGLQRKFEVRHGG